MKDKTKITLENTGLAAADTVAAGVDAVLGGAPLATGAWGLAKAFLGRGLVLRQQKAVEWVEMIRDNPSFFTKELLLTDEFQDAFVTSLEAYIKERNHDKRIILQAIFKDYTNVANPSVYPLERFNEITKQISIYDAKNFSYILKLNKEVQPGRAFEASSDKIESTLHLISLGLLIRGDQPTFIADQPGARNPAIYVSSLGAIYAKFIEESISQNHRL